MDMAVLEHKVSFLTAMQQESLLYYIDFLLSQNTPQTHDKRKALDFSKYNTSTHVWNEDAQAVVDRMRSDDRF